MRSYRHFARVAALFGFAITLIGITSNPAHAARLAFVIGNNDYRVLGPLRNAVPDATDMAAELRRSGFTVHDRWIVLNGGRERMRDAFKDFVGSIGPSDEVVFFYSGHGAQIGAVAALLPVDLRDPSKRPLDGSTRPVSEVEQAEQQVLEESLSLNQVAAQIAKRAPKLSLLVVDACRDNPVLELLRRANVGKGVPDAGAAGFQMEQESDTQLLLFAASRGQQALDRLGSTDAVRNGVFTRVLLEEMRRPNNTLADLVPNVQQRVQQLAATVRATGGQPHQQRPRAVAMFPFPGAGFSFLATGAAPSPRPAPEPPPAPSVGNTLKDCEVCPELVVLPKGSFTMGSPSSEVGRDNDEGPQQRLTIDRTLAVGKYHVTKGQYAVFVRATGRSDGDGCNVSKDDVKWEKQSDKSWRNAGFGQEDNHPVVCVSWEDAKAYVAWLNSQAEIKRLPEGQRYRLLTEGEWEYAARAGTSTRYWWGEDEKNDQQCRYANGADQTTRPENGNSWSRKAECKDGYWYTSPVGKYQSNRWGLYDMSGNAWQWVEDCWVDSLNGMPSNGTARTSGCTNASLRVQRGGSWGSGPQRLRAASRGWVTTDFRIHLNGFRVARTVNF